MEKILDTLSQLDTIHFVFIYLVMSIIIGILAGMKIKTASDFVNAGRNLPLPIVMATVFATWFGSEAILGMPAEFIKEGFAGIIKDPFGAFFCLSIVGMFFAKRWYKFNVVTLANIYEKRFGTKVELLMTVAIVISYFGWVAAQMTALGVVINILSQGVISQEVGIVIGASVVLLYTISGGMLSIAFNDFIQFLIIVFSLCFLMFFFSNKAGGFMHVINTANDNNMFVFIRNYDTQSIIHFLGALFTLMLGSIPQQDIFQRVTSARNENVAQKGMLMGASLYLLFCLMPIFLVFSATIVDPSLVNKLIEEDSQMILPSFILTYTPMFIKVLFFGSLLAAIMSTASGTLLAPSVTIAENIVKKIFQNLSDKKYILVLRLTLLITGISVTLFALQSNSSIYEMVGNAYKITLVSAVVPLFAAMFSNRATTIGAYTSIAFGLIVWIAGEIEGIIEPQFFGFLASLIGMIIGSYLSKPEPNKLANLQ